MTPTTLAWLGVGSVVVVTAEYASGLTGWLLVADATVAFGFVVLAAVTAGGSWKYAALSAATAASWLVAGLLPGTSWAHRGLIVWLVLSFPSVRIAPNWGCALPAGAALAGLLPPGPGRSVAMAVVGGAVALWSLTGTYTTHEWVPMGASRRRAGVLVGLALTVPLLTLASGASGRSVETAAGVAYCGLVAAAVGSLCVGSRAMERGGADHVIALSESEGAQAALDRLRNARQTQPDNRAQPAIDSAISLLERNVALQQQLRSAVVRARVARAELAAALMNEQFILRNELSDNAYPVLEAVGAALSRVVRADVDPLGTELLEQSRGDATSIRSELEALAEGLHPLALRERGLRALAELVEHAPVPVLVDVPADRLTPEVEAALWFSCTEAIANALKHGNPKRVTVTGAVRHGGVTVEVADDGVGGARLVPGGGLSALRDRLSGVGGFLHVGPTPAGGTAVRLEVPLP